MLRFFFIFLMLFFFNANAANKIDIIKNFQKIDNLSFDFEQNINGKIEEGECIIEYPGKIYCIYNTSNNKVLVSNGKSLVIKTGIGSYYRYPLNNTPLKLILDKNFIITNIKNLNEDIIDEKFINFKLNKDNLKIEIFFNTQTLNIAGWQTLDIYQNESFTMISNIITNQYIEPDTFKLPKSN